MISNDDNKKEIKDKNDTLNEIKEKYNKLIKNKSNTDNICDKEINCLNKILENSNAIDKFHNYINNDFLDNCEYKLIFMPEEFAINENNKYYFTGLGEKKRKKINLKNKNNNNNRNNSITGKRNKRKYD